MSEESKQRTQANKELRAISMRFHKLFPIGEIQNVLKKHGFSIFVLDLRRVGRRGKTTVRVGSRSSLYLAWFTNPDGLYGVDVYLS